MTTEDHYYEGVSVDVREFVRQNVDVAREHLAAVELVGDCRESVYIWRDLLREANYRPKLCWGRFDVGHGQSVPHWWLEVGGGLFDPTGQQFWKVERVRPSGERYHGQCK